MQQTTALYKQLNFSVSNIRKLKKSIRHSLQLIDKIHFDPTLTDRSWIYSPDGKTRNLLKIPEDKREGFADKLISRLAEQIEQFKADNLPTESETERQKLTKVISARRTDLKKEISKGNYTEEQKTFIKNLLENGLEVSEKLPENIDILEGTKAKKIAAKVIQLHNARTLKPTYKAPLCGRTVVMQESFFKFPIHNGVTLEDNDYHAILTGYYAKYFPQYDIKLAVFHGNEKAKGEPDFNKHCHIFTSTYNKKTKKYDFLDREIEQANAYAKANGLEGIERKNLDNLPLLGELRQKMFYEYAQEYLNTHKCNVELYFLPDTDHRREQRKLIRRQDKLPKEERFYNQVNFQQEKISASQKSYAKQMNEQNTLIAHQKKELDEKEQKILRAAKQLKNRNKQLKIIESEQQKEWQVLSGIQNFLQRLFKWANAVISSSKEDAKTIKEELKNDLKRFEIGAFSDKLQATLAEAERMAEATERRTNIEDRLKVSPNIKDVRKKYFKLTVAGQR